jgi:GH35 family endo-1,4-beta-xylanase
MDNRRNFILKMAATCAGTMIFPACTVSKSGKTIKEGEEWKMGSSMAYKGSGNYGLTEELQEQADAAIEKIRKGKVNIRLVDKNQRPLHGFKVHLKQQTHDFDWGFSGASTICGMTPAQAKRTEYVKDLFNCTTAKCYWDEGWHQPIEKVEGKRITETFTGEINWGRANELRVKGHPLVWTVRKAIPKWMDKYSYAVQMQKLEEHVRDLIRVGGDSVTQWDLCNEMLWEPSLRNLPQRDWPHLEPTKEILTYLEPAVHWAKDENPFATYVLNDYGLVKTYAPGVTAQQQRQRYVELIKEMRRRGCEPDALGTQCHVASWYTSEEFITMLDELSEADLPIQITEFWARMENLPFEDMQDEMEKQQALVVYVSMMYTLAFAHPKVNHFTYWGSNEWFDEDGNPTPVYGALYDLIKNKWMTTESMVTNAQGEVTLKAFYGQYDVLVQDENGNSRYQSFKLDRNNNEITLQF